MFELLRFQAMCRVCSFEYNSYPELLRSINSSGMYCRGQQYIPEALAGETFLTGDRNIYRQLRSPKRGSPKVVRGIRRYVMDALATHGEHALVLVCEVQS